MGRDATKASGNPWYEARIKAAKYDERLLSREGASERLGMSVSAVADAELGLSKCMPVDKAVLMADLYKAPQLLNYYCLNECPIGCKQSISADVYEIDRITVKLLKRLRVSDLERIKEKLVDISDDGKVDDSEKPALREVLDYLDDLAKTISELKTLGNIALGGDKNES